MLVRDFRQPAIYWDPCHGIPPTPIGTSEDFFTGQIFVVAVAVIVLFFAV